MSIGIDICVGAQGSFSIVFIVEIINLRQMKMVAYFSGGNPNMLVANAHKLDEDHRKNVIACLLKFDREFSTEWNRTAESLMIEWEGHHKWRIASSAKHIDFDNNGEGMPLEYYDEKACSRIEEFLNKIFRRG